MLRRPRVFAAVLGAMAIGCHTMPAPQPAAPPGATGTRVESAPDPAGGVRESDINLVNVHDVVIEEFVRRAATPVFRTFYASLKNQLAVSGAPTQEQVQVDATMNASGELVSCSIVQRAAPPSLDSDRLLLEACQQSLSDPGPPPAARSEDGNIYFVFRTTIQSQTTPRGTAYGLRLDAGLR